MSFLLSLQVLWAWEILLVSELCLSSDPCKKSLFLLLCTSSAKDKKLLFLWFEEYSKLQGTERLGILCHGSSLWELHVSCITCWNLYVVVVITSYIAVLLVGFISSVPLKKFVLKLSNFVGKQNKSVLYWHYCQQPCPIRKADPGSRSSGNRQAWIGKVPTLLSPSCGD